MIHFSCDRCERRINSEEEFRYVVRIEARAALDVAHDGEDEGDRDDLMELHELIESADERCNEDAPFHQLRYDLCPECYSKFMQNPVGVDVSRQFNFSQN